MKPLAQTESVYLRIVWSAKWLWVWGRKNKTTLCPKTKEQKEGNEINTQRNEIHYNVRAHEHIDWVTQNR